VRAVTLALVVLTFCAMVEPRAAAANPSEALELARTEFRAGNYKEAIPMLTTLLYPTSQLTGAGEIAEAHLLLGVSYFETNRPDSAETEIEEALALDPNLTISTSISKPAADFFEGKKREFERREKEQAIQTERARLRANLKSTPVYEAQQYWLNFVPFGVGQLQNGQRGKAIAFFASEAAMAAASFGIWIYLNRTYPNGQVPRDEIDAALNLQRLEIVSGGAFLLLAGWGIVDSILNYEPTRTRQMSDAEIEKILEERKPEPSALHVNPFVTPDGAGAALTWEF